MQNYSLEKFEVFLMVAELKSITNSAKELGVSKSSVSRDIRLLEQELGVPLLIRSTRKIDLTEEGQTLAKQCQRLKRELDATRSLVDDLHAEPSGLLRVYANPYFAEEHLIHKIHGFLDAYPKVDLELFFNARMPDMEKEQVDLIFGVTWPTPLDIVAKAIAKTRYVICASPQYLKQYGIPKTLEDLKNHHYIPHIGRSLDNLIPTLKTPLTVKPRFRLKMDDQNYMRDCAIEHLGIIALHDYVVKKELQSGRLVEILSEFVAPEVDVMVFYQKHRYVQPKIRQFLKLMLED